MVNLISHLEISVIYPQTHNNDVSVIDIYDDKEYTYFYPAP